MVRRFRAAASAAALLAAVVANALPARAASTSTIFTTQVATSAATASKPIEVGVKFRSDSPGTVTGVRFFKLSSANSGTHIGDLWSASGQLLASATFTGETASGWQTALFSTPVAISSNTTYVASYHTTTQYSVTRNYFTGAGVDNAPLHALQSAASSVNGVYAYGAGPTFPNNGVADSNWWADVVFQPAGGPPPPPGCAVSAGAWLNFPFSAQTGTFQARFDAVPLQGSMDGVAGVAASAASDFSQLAAVVRFSTGGYIDARDGGGYHASSPMPYIVGSTHTFRLELNVPAKRYNAFVSVNGSAEQLLASNFAFRTEQNGVSSLSDLGAQADAGSERVCAPVISAWTPVASSWTAVASMPEAHNDFAMSLLADGKALVIGGSVFDPQFTSALYDPASGSWSSVGLLNDAREHPTATLLPNGKVLVAGGQGGQEPLGTAELFDPASGAFVRTGAMSTARMNHSAVLLPNGKVLVAGGGAATAELYDPASGTWSATGSMSVVRGRFTLTLLQSGKVLAAGGFGDASHGPSTAAEASAELYDPAAGSWTPTGSMATARTAHAAVLLDDGRVLVAGGSGSANGSAPLASAELYDPATGTWSSVAPMPTARAYPAAALRGDGTVLVAGGTGNTDATASLAAAELFDPATGAWKDAGPMTTQRVFFGAVTLHDGRVLAAGGQNVVGAALASAEVYAAATNPKPALSSISPSSAPVGGGGFTLTARGSFAPRSVIRWNGADRPTTFVSASTLTAAIPASDLAASGTAAVTVFTSTPGGGLSNALPFAVGSAPVSSSSTTIFTTQAPTGAASASQPIEVGVKFRSDSDGTVTGVRFYKLSSANSGTHIGDLWSASGQLLASATFGGETASGWQTVLFSNPVPIQAGATYVASYHTTTQYSVTRNYFTSAGVDNAPLHALKTGVSGVNGAYAYGAGPTFPVNGVSDSNWWADVIFQSTSTAAPPPPQPPSITSIDPIGARAGSVSTFTLTVIGQNFSTSSVVQWNGSQRPTTFEGSTGLTATIFSSDVQSPGVFLVTVFDPSEGTSNSVQFTVESNGPQITSLSPSSSLAGSGAFTLSVLGQGFSSTSVVRWNDSPRPTTFVSASRLTASISSSDIQSVGYDQVQVTDGNNSNVAQFTVFQATPTAQWTQTGPMKSAHFGQPVVQLLDGRVFVPGGDSDNQFPSEVYDPGSDSWSTAGTADRPVDRSATTLADGRVLLAGGVTGEVCCSAGSELFTPATTSYATTGSLKQARANQTATLLLDGRVLAAGGMQSSEFPLSQSFAELYDPASGSWSLTGSMTTGRYDHAAIRLADGRVLVAGGVNSVLVGTTPVAQVTASVEIYDPATGTWSTTSPMSTPRQLPAAALLKDGRVFVAAGISANGGSLASAEIFDPATGRWTSANSMAAARADAAATLLADGSVLIAGGGTNMAERYDPVAESWSSAGAMHFIRNAQRAELLRNGQVLVVDGQEGAAVASTAERYDPGPFLSALSPSSASAGGSSFNLSVTGLLFSTSSIVHWNGSPRATTFVSASTLTASIPSSDISAAGTAQISISDPAGLSNTVSFTIGPPSPPGGSTTTIVSLTFDDSTSSHTVAQAILDAHGVKGTFFVISGRVGHDGSLTLAEVRDLANDGHEVAGHTVDHPDLTTLVSSAVVHEICDDKTQLETWGFKPFNFAYPFGAANPDVEAAAKSCGYTSARGVGGLTCSSCPVAETIPPANPYYIATAESIKGTTTLEQMESYVTSAEQAGGGWVPLVMHVITDDPAVTYSISSATLSAFLDWLGPRAASGTVVRTIGQVLGTPVKPPAPYLSSISPQAAQAGGPAFTLSAFGLGFSTSSVVRWNGAARQTAFLSSSTLTAAIPASDLAAGGTVQVTIAGPTGVSDAQPFTVFPAPSGSTTTIFSTLIATSASTASKPIEVGVKFRSDTAGNAVGVRFYKLSSANSGTHMGELWSEAGTLLASATFTAETPSGWQTVLFSTPVAILANTTYVASYHTTTMYSVTRNYFTNAGVDNPPLHALKTGVSGINGVYAYGAGPTFPTNGVSDSNWWADVVFQPAGSGSPMAAMGLSAAALAPSLSTATAAEQTFGFRDLYVFPNPSRRGRSMTIRLQAGVADAAELKIYDLSGRLIREAPFGAPRVLDDGNGKGPQFTYDYQWDVGGVGSGVYIFRVTARKSGEPEIDKIGKGAIIK